MYIHNLYIVFAGSVVHREYIVKKRETDRSRERMRERKKLEKYEVTKQLDKQM